MLLKESLRLAQLIQVVSVILNIAISSHKKATRSGCRVLNDFSGLRLHKTDNTINQWARGKILPCSRFLFSCILFKQAFVKISEALFTRRKPVQFVDRIGESLKVRRFPKLALSVRK